MIFKIIKIAVILVMLSLFVKELIQKCGYFKCEEDEEGDWDWKTISC